MSDTRQISGDDYDSIRALLTRLNKVLLENGRLMQVGWVKFDGDEYYGFTYSSSLDRHANEAIRAGGFLPVFVLDTPTRPTSPRTDPPDGDSQVVTFGPPEHFGQ